MITLKNFYRIKLWMGACSDLYKNTALNSVKITDTISCIDVWSIACSSGLRLFCLTVLNSIIRKIYLFV